MSRSNSPTNYVKSLALNGIHLLERATRTRIHVRRHPKLRGQGGAKLDGGYLSEIVRLFRQLTNDEPRNVFDIGSNYGQSAAYLAHLLGLDDAVIHAFEPHPELAGAIRNAYGFRVTEAAVSNSDGVADLFAVDLEGTNSGISSLSPHSKNPNALYTPSSVRKIRMDTYLRENELASCDLVKIDVEGHTLEVLEGFGGSIDRVKSIQLEAEFMPVWEGQGVWSDISRHLEASGFQMAHFVLHEDGIQSDSFWIKTTLVKHRIFNISTGIWHDI